MLREQLDKEKQKTEDIQKRFESDKGMLNRLIDDARAEINDYIDENIEL